MPRLRGSKYLQSMVGGTYKDVKEALEQGKYVLFTGTPCQISGIKRYLGKEYEKLILADLICHGVPSEKIWKKYLEYQCKKHCADGINLINFRDKSKGWYEYDMRIEFNNGKVYSKHHEYDLFLRAFKSCLNSRPSCYDCHSKSLERESDITLGDFWGVDITEPEMYDDKGTSLVIVNSPKGERIMNEIADKIYMQETDMDKAVAGNTSLFRSAKYTERRNQFMNDADIMPIDRVVRKYAPYNYMLWAKQKLRRMIIGWR